MPASTPTLKIQRNVPIPEGRGIQSPLGQIITKMKHGDSVLIPAALAGRYGVRAEYQFRRILKRTGDKLRPVMRRANRTGDYRFWVLTKKKAEL